MIKKTLSIFIIIIIIVVGIFLLWSKKIPPRDLANPQILQSSTQQTSEPTPVPINAPKTFKYDRSTDLKQEWDSINPQILDSDF